MNSETRDSIAGYLSRVMNSDPAKVPKNKVQVRIAGETFTIIAPESEEYIRRVAAMVDEKITSVISSSRMPIIDAAVLAACNLADEQLKAVETAENLRQQIKAYIDDMARLRTELNDARREIARLTK
ncbi:MAG: cell division protein ZapA [Clostridiales bacterium]|nr:cell division protein ZapA [Clostridiales bacterium]